VPGPSDLRRVEAEPASFLVRRPTPGRNFTEDDLFSLLWLAGTASRAPDAPKGWQRIILRALDSAWTTRVTEATD
jgi:hypothetical protein